MSIYSGFATRQQEETYDHTVDTLLYVLQKRLLKFYLGQPSQEKKFFEIVLRLHAQLKKLEASKYLEPKSSIALKELATFLSLHKADAIDQLKFTQETACQCPEEDQQGWTKVNPPTTKAKTNSFSSAQGFSSTRVNKATLHRGSNSTQFKMRNKFINFKVDPKHEPLLNKTMNLANTEALPGNISMLPISHGNPSSKHSRRTATSNHQHGMGRGYSVNNEMGKDNLTSNGLGKDNQTSNGMGKDNLASSPMGKDYLINSRLVQDIQNEEAALIDQPTSKRRPSRQGSAKSIKYGLHAHHTSYGSRFRVWAKDRESYEENISRVLMDSTLKLDHEPRKKSSSRRVRSKGTEDQDRKVGAIVHVVDRSAPENLDSSMGEDIVEVLNKGLARPRRSRVTIESKLSNTE